MHRFFLQTTAGRGATVTLDEGDSHHATRVLRLSVGAVIEILDGSGRCLRSRVIEANKRAMRAEVDEVVVRPAPPRVGLAPSVLKGKAMDFLVQKATELGVATLKPLVIERAVVRVPPEDAEARVNHWRQIAIQACKQCGNPWMPVIQPPSTLSVFLEVRTAGFLLVASLRSDARPVRPILSGWVDGNGEVTLIVGPEGDFTPDEEEALRSAGAQPLSLGPLVLRAETAAIAGLAIIQHELAALANRLSDHPTG